MGGLIKKAAGEAAGFATKLNFGYQAARSLGVSKSNAVLQGIDPTQVYRNNYAESGTNPLKQTIGDAAKGSKQILNLEGSVVGRKSPVFSNVVGKAPPLPLPPVIPMQDPVEAEKVRRKAAQRRMSLGRESTILSLGSGGSDSEPLG